MLDIKTIRKDFPMYRNKVKMQGKDLIWLDNASTTFKPDCVIDAMNNYYCFGNSNAHRGDYDLAFHADSKIAESRETIAKFLNAETNEIVFTGGDTDALNLVAYGYGLSHLKEGDEILVTEAEHASNFLPWYNVAKLTGASVKVIPLDKEGRLTLENTKASLTPKTKIISFAHVGNVFGYIAPAKEIIAFAHSKGIVVVLDGAQSIPHLSTDVKDLDVDFLTFSGHKCCGPNGVGVLYGKKKILDETEPYVTGGGMNHKFDAHGNYSYLEAPFKFEAGTQPIPEIIGLGEAIKYISSIGLDNIHRHEIELARYAIEEIKKTGLATIYNENTDSGIVTFNVNNVFSQDFASYLNSKGIACRSGNHCAKALPEFLGTQTTVRASFYLYTSKEDIDALVDAIKHGKEFLDAYF